MKFVFFPVSENGENGLGDKGPDGGNASQNFWARTAPDNPDPVDADHGPDPKIHLLPRFLLSLSLERVK